MKNTMNNPKKSATKISMAMLLSLALLPAFSGSAQAGLANPLIRFCVINGGTFEVHPRGPSNDIALCRWNQVVVDSQTLVSKLEGTTTEAANVILQDLAGADCQDVRANEMKITNGPTLCVFKDDSMLSVETLKTGLSNLDRQHLKDVLSTR